MLPKTILSIPLLALVSFAQTGDELTTAYNNLKAAEEQKDVDAVKKWATGASQHARAIVKAAAPTDPAEVAAHQARLDFAKQVEAYADYALYVNALRAPDAAKRAEMFEALEQQSPASEYVPKLYGLYAGALGQLGQQPKLIQFAEKAIAKSANDEDLLAILSDHAVSRKQWERAAAFATRLATVMSSHPKPEGLPTGDWERKRTTMLSRGYYIAGVSYAMVNKYPQTDKNLRAALPLIKGDAQMTAAALFHLGVANYNLARITHSKPQMKEAVSFADQAAKIPGPYQDQAIKNAWNMKQELDRMR